MSTSNDQTLSSGDPNEMAKEIPTEVRLVREAWQKVGIADDETRLAPASTMGPVGRRLNVPGYRLVREISRGGQGVVFLAMQENTKRQVALKVMLQGVLAGERERRRFEREVEILASMRHPNIVTIHDSGTVDGFFYYVMDFIAGVSLDHYVSNNEMEIADSLRLFQKIASAVNAAHRMGVLHRDLKPGNIRVGEDGEPYILDFGLAKGANDTDERQLSVTGQFLGTLPWASPEQAVGVPGKIDLRTDVYALGVILYQMLTGAFPYSIVGPMNEVIDNILYAKPTPPSKLRRKINHEVETILLKCLSKDPERRYQSAGELARDIDNYLNGHPIEAKRDSIIYVLRKRARRHKFQSAVFILMLLVVMSSGAVAIDLGRQLWTANQRARSSDLAAMTNSVLLDRAIGDTTLPAMRQMALGWFIAAREDGRADRLDELRHQQPAGCPTRLVMDYWANDNVSDEELLNRIEPDHRGLARFAIGIRAMWSGDNDRAVDNLRAARSTRLLPIIDEEAGSILEQLTADGAK